MQYILALLIIILTCTKSYAAENTSLDIDGDGIANESDAFPYDPSRVDPMEETNCDEILSVCYRFYAVHEKVEIYIRNNIASPIFLDLNLIDLKNLEAERFDDVNVTLSEKSEALVAILRLKEPSTYWDFSFNYKYQIGDPDAIHDSGHVYQLPFSRGSAFTVSQGYNGELSHAGGWEYAIDFDMPIGTPVLAARGGVVVEKYNARKTGGTGFHNFDTGNFISILQDDGSIATYCHLVENGAIAGLGSIVKTGQVIGLSGRTGFTNAAVLHFSVHTVVNIDEIESHPVMFESEKGLVTELTEGIQYESVNGDIVDIGDPSDSLDSGSSGQDKDDGRLDEDSASDQLEPKEVNEPQADENPGAGELRLYFLLLIFSILVHRLNIRFK